MRIVKNVKIIPMVLIIIGIVLILDQLYLFGIPFGPFLPNLASYDPTGSPVIHHWMLGVVMVVIGYIMLNPYRSRL